MAQYLVFLVATVLRQNSPRPSRLPPQARKTLHKADELRNIVFVSTNYDILIDNALTEEPERGYDLDYGIEFRNFDPSFVAITTGDAQIWTIACSSSSRTAH